MKEFERFLCEKNDEIDSLAHQLLATMNTTKIGNDTDPEDLLEWDMEYIGDLVDYAEMVLLNHKKEPCHPYHEGDEATPCYLGNDCKRKDCPFRKEEN